MKTVNNLIKKTIGFKGELCVMDKLKTKGYVLFGKNIKKGINCEIDIVMYKYDFVNNTLDIRVIEVKTRKSYQFDLSCFGLNKKWRLLKPYFFKIKSEIDELYFDSLKYSSIHFDLALVVYKEDFYCVYGYFEDVDLMLQLRSVSYFDNM